MKDFIKAIDNLPWIVKLILCIPALDIVWAIYRIIKGLETKNTVMLIAGILWIFPGAAFLWIWDIVTTFLYKHPKLA